MSHDLHTMMTILVLSTELNKLVIPSPPNVLMSLDLSKYVCNTVTAEPIPCTIH